MKAASTPAPAVSNGSSAPAARRARKLAVSGSHSCALLDDATVHCWGENERGQLGDGTTTDRNRPVQVAGLAPAADITAGENFTCALMRDATVQCWGGNGLGQLGGGESAAGEKARSKPGAVIGLQSVKRIAAGHWHAIALIDGGKVVGWGQNERGQLGDGTTTNRTSAVPLAGLSGVTLIASGGSHSCALLGTGSLQCWGYNSAGQLGDGSNGKKSDKSSPVSVSVQGVTGVAALSLGSDHSCALLTGGKLRCWGAKGPGQLGDSLVPKVGLNGGVEQVSAGDAHACAILADRSLRCWGENGSGQIGGDPGSEGVDQQSSIPGNYDEIAVGRYHTCARSKDSTVTCWGNNTHGQLGYGGTASTGFAQRVDF